MKIKITELKCERCGHIWIPKKEEIRQCPKCKTAWWDRKMKKEKIKIYEDIKVLEKLTKNHIKHKEELCKKIFGKKDGM